MCHHCGAELRNSEEKRKIQENVNSLKLGTQDSILSCKYCGLKHEQESVLVSARQSPYATQMISPTSSLSSSDRSASSCSKLHSICHGLVILIELGQQLILCCMF